MRLVITIDSEIVADLIKIMSHKQDVGKVHI